MTMTLAEGEELAARILEFIPEQDPLGMRRHFHHARKRVESDLAGLRYVLEGGLHGKHLYLATMFENNLKRTASEYGVRV